MPHLLASCKCVQRQNPLNCETVHMLDVLCTYSQHGLATMHQQHWLLAGRHGGHLLRNQRGHDMCGRLLKSQAHSHPTPATKHNTQPKYCSRRGVCCCLLLLHHKAATTVQRHLHKDLCGYKCSCLRLRCHRLRLQRHECTAVYATSLPPSTHPTSALARLPCTASAWEPTSGLARAIHASRLPCTSAAQEPMGHVVCA